MDQRAYSVIQIFLISNLNKTERWVEQNNRLTERTCHHFTARNTHLALELFDFLIRTTTFML